MCGLKYYNIACRLYGENCSPLYAHNINMQVVLLFLVCIHINYD